MVDKSTWIYHEMVLHVPITQYSFEKIKKSFEFWSPKSKVSTLTPANASGLTIWSTNARIHKINGPTLKPFSRVQVEDKLKETRLFFEETFLVID